MTLFRLGIFVAGFFCFGFVGASDLQTTWQPTQWQGERAMISTSSGWKAIVSLERGRLVHFGPAGNDTNLIFAPKTRDDPAGWGGDRVWLGPQAQWAQIWPPPAAWEHSGADPVSVTAGMLRLIMPEAGDGWPRLTRTYRWNGKVLVCGVETSGGTRGAQVIHIVQVPRQTVVNVTARPDKGAPLGYVQLPSSATPRFTTDFTPPPHVTTKGQALTLRHIGHVQKLGFNPQPLTAHEGSLGFTVSRGEQHGTVVSEPDAGFFTQVYLGGPEPFIELEQLSPSFSPGAGTSFSIELEGSAP
ncbi:MAG TPA: hypothetical protein VGM64_01755 [Lacunisphaera sp.]|jgi:hypothetical protein